MTADEEWENKVMMTKVKPAIRALTVLALVSMMLAACGSSSPSAGSTSPQGPIVVGAPIALTGIDSGSAGSADATVAKEYVAQVNASGGIDGRQIKLVVMDTQSSATVGLLDIRQMITQDHAVALVGVSGTTLGEDMLPIVKQYKIPTFADIGAGSFNNPGSPYFFKIPEGPTAVAKLELGYMKKEGLKTFAWLGIGNGFGQLGIPVFEKVAKAYGMTMLDSYLYSATSTNLTSDLERVKGLPGMQALVIYGIPPTSFIIQSEIATAGITVPVFQGNGAALGAFASSSPAANGATVVGGNLNVYQQLPASNPQVPVIKAFVKMYGSSANRFAGDMYDCMALLVRAMKAVGTSGPAIESYMNTKVVNVPGVTGIFTFNQNIHGGVVPSSLSVMKVVNGRFKLEATGSQVVG